VAARAYAGAKMKVTSGKMLTRGTFLAKKQAWNQKNPESICDFESSIKMTSMTEHLCQSWSFLVESW